MISFWKMNDHERTPSTLVYYKKHDFKVSTQLAQNCKSYRLRIFGTGPLYP